MVFVIRFLAVLVFEMGGMAIQKRASVLVEAVEDPKPAERRALLSAASTQYASAQKGVGPTRKCDAPHDRRHGVRHDFVGRGRLVQRQSFVRDALSVCTCAFHVQSKQEVSDHHVPSGFRCANDHAPAANPRFPPSNKPRALCGTASGAPPGILDLACPAARRQAARMTTRAAMPAMRTIHFSSNLPQPSHNSHPLSEFHLSQLPSSLTTLVLSHNPLCANFTLNVTISYAAGVLLIVDHGSHVCPPIPLEMPSSKRGSIQASQPSLSSPTFL